MIELRWVWKDEPAPEIGPDIARRVKVLQYRTTTIFANVLPHSIELSEWQDVPTDSEGRG